MAWLTGYNYRKQITIKGSSAGVQTNYQMKLNVHKGSGSDSGDDVYLGGSCRNDFNDIRFTKSDGETKLDYWRESYVSGDYAIFWIEFDSIPADPDSVNFYIYYDNSDASSESSGGDAFLFFDDFKLNDEGAWCWFQDPRAIRYVGTYDKTYWGYVNKSGDIKIGSYDHDSQKTVFYTLHSNLQVDDHAAPAILVRNDGKLLVVYVSHNGDTIYYRISSNAEDISAWGAEQTINSTNVSYISLVQLSGESNKIYLFYRGDELKEWSYRTSIDGGANWSSSQLLLAETENAQYLKIISNGNDKIYFAHSGHPYYETTSIYFFYYYNNALYKADGTKICDVPSGLPIDRSDMELVYDASENYKAWIWDIALDNGAPVIAFVHFVSTTDHRYDYAKWNGSSWDIGEITAAGTYLYSDEPYYSGGISIDKESPTTVYLSKEVSSQWEVQKWAYSGGSWSKSEDITSNSSKKNIRPVVIRNHHADLPIFWMWGDYPSYTTYDTTIVSKSPEDNWELQQGMINFREGAIYLIGATSGTQARIESKTAISLGAALHTRVKSDTNDIFGSAHICAMRKTGDWNYRAGDLYGKGTVNQLAYETRDEGNYEFTDNIGADDLSAYHEYQVYWLSGSSKAYQDSSILVTHTTEIPTIDQIVVLHAANAAGYNAWFDWVFVRKYVDPEPTWEAWGEPEASSRKKAAFFEMF